LKQDLYIPNAGASPGTYILSDLGEQLSDKYKACAKKVPHVNSNYLNSHQMSSKQSKDDCVDTNIYAKV
jgi:hypothetical protein